MMKELTVKQDIVEKPNRNIKKIIFLILTGLVVLSAIVLVVLFANKIAKEYESPVNKYFAGIRLLSIEKMMEAYPPEIRTKMESDLTPILSILEKETEKAFSVKYDIKKGSKLNEYQIKDIAKTLKEKYNYNVSISKAYKIEVESILEYDDTKVTVNKKMQVIKVGWTWYLIE